MLYVRADIPSNLLDFEDKRIERLFIELNLQNTKIVINCSYNPHKSEIKKHLTALRNSLDIHSSKYEKVLMLGDFNVEIEEANMKLFCENYNLKSLIKQPNCYKSPNKPACIDLILTNVSKHKTEENRLLYTQQRNKCVSLLRKTKMNYYGNLNEKDITDNKKFWKTVMPFLSDKSINSDKIHLNENGELINSKTKTAEVLNEFFSNIVKNLKIPEYENLNCNF